VAFSHFTNFPWASIAPVFLYFLIDGLTVGTDKPTVLKMTVDHILTLYNTPQYVDASLSLYISQPFSDE
jgi:hypothetical protein